MQSARPPAISSLLGFLFLAVHFAGIAAPDVAPAPQQFLQEVAVRFGTNDGLPTGPVQLLDLGPDHACRVFAAGQWYELRQGSWRANQALASRAGTAFVFPDEPGTPITVPVPWHEVRQLLRFANTTFLLASNQVLRISGAKLQALGSPDNAALNELAISPEGTLHVASNDGLFALTESRWQRFDIRDQRGRAWAVDDVRGVAFDSGGRLWFAAKAGVGCRGPGGWTFYEGKDGLPWNDFTWITAGPKAPGDSAASSAEIWFGTHLGVIRFDGVQWHYRQGSRWLPDDNVKQLAVQPDGTAWIATASGLGAIERRPMTLATKAEFYEQEIERYIKRTPYGFVAEAHLRRAADKSSADPQDSDNDGMWTASYGAGECFAYAATRDPKAKERAGKAFAALRFLQKVTQDCDHAPPKGYVARTVRPVDWPDPNTGRLASDREAQKQDKLWKAYEPRWPKSADGKWFWKSDTSSDELDGHYFFYPLYYDFCAETDAERERVREVVRDLTDHLVTHGFVLVDHDGKPTRWGIYGPQYLNQDPLWWQERGLKSLSILCYLAVAAHITGDAKYDAAARDLIDHHSYAHNAMLPKVQHGPGSGNQSDDEMAFMGYYGLLRYSKDEALKSLIRYSFFNYWANEAPEMSPFFNFAYAAHNLHALAPCPWGQVPLDPWRGWLEDAMATLYGFPLDRLNWPSRNSHRLDLVELPRVAAEDLDEPDRPHSRGYRVNGKVIPVENRHFNHWNTDPWQLDYGGNGDELAAGTVFLLPYYMGLYHGFIERPAR